MRGPDESGVRQLPQQVLDVAGHLVRGRPVRPGEPAGDLLGRRPAQHGAQHGGPGVVVRPVPSGARGQRLAPGVGVRPACGGWAAAHGGPMPTALPHDAANHPF
nr:hypothetical protein [Streptomyces sp. AA0539]